MLFVIARHAPWLRAQAKRALPPSIVAWLLTQHRQSARPTEVDVSTRIQSLQTMTTQAFELPPGPGRLDIICLANIDWAARFQRPQQMMSQFARHGYRVFYVVASRLPPPGQPYSLAEVSENIFEVAIAFSRTQDFYGQTMLQANVHSCAAAFAALARDYRIKTAVTVLHLPYWYPLAHQLRVDRGWLMQYDCMDDWVGFPNIKPETLAEEERLVADADLVTVTASLLYDKWSKVACKCLLVRNAVDFDFFSNHCAPNDLLTGLERPIIGFYGALAEWIDFDLIAAVADCQPGWNIVLVGDVFVTDLHGLDRKLNVHFLGKKPYADMPRYLYHFDVCLIPFRLYNVSHAVDPVKFYEFASVGKPVVAAPLDEMKIYRDLVYSAQGAEAFVQQISLALAENDATLADRRIALARANDWRDRFDSTQSALHALYDKLSVIVITYNNVALTRECIESLLRNTTHPRYELIVVDNASSDDTRNYLRYVGRKERHVRIILNEENRGFAAANNQGLRVATGEFLVLLNNDTVVPRGWSDPLVRHLRDEGIGLVGPVTNFVGNEAKVTTNYTDWAQMEVFSDDYTARHHGQTFDIAMLAMFCVALRRDVLERVGWLDEQFGIGMFEDDDYSRRVREAGLRCVCAQDAFVHHHGQAAFKKLIATGDYQRLWDKNQAYFESKWGTWVPHASRTAAMTGHEHA